MSIIARQVESTPQSPPDSLVNSPAFTRLCRRNRARFLFGLLRLRRGLDPANPFDAELADAIDVETDRLSSLLRSGSASAPPPTFPARVTRRVRAHMALLYRDLDLGERDDALAADLLELVDAFMVERSQLSILLRRQTLQRLAGRL